MRRQWFFIPTLICAILSLLASSIPIKEESFQIGHFLFFDQRLSATGTKSCSSCHDPNFAFTDGYRLSEGIYADLTKHNTPSILNLNSYHSLNWASPNLRSIEDQMKGPLFGKNPIELGMDSTNTNFLKTLFSAYPYNQFKSIQQLAKKSNEEKWKFCQNCLTDYISTLNSRNSNYDKFLLGNEQALTAVQKLGKDLFFSSKYKCASCHGGLDFNQSVMDTTNLFSMEYHIENPKSPKTMRVPSLRNVALTAPYMHDGSFDKLEECLDLYFISNKDSTFTKIEMSPEDRKSIIHFLYTLSDVSYLNNPKFQNPFTW